MGTRQVKTRLYDSFLAMGTLVLADSRGTGLQQMLEGMGVIGKGLVTVLVYRGAGYEMTAIKAMPTITKLRPKLIILLTGVCDLTYRDRRTKVTNLRHHTVGDNILHVITAAKAAVDLITSTSDAKVVLATLTGIELKDYNNPARKSMDSEKYKLYNTDKVRHRCQEVLNTSILEINRQLVAINKSNSLPTLWTAGLVHSCFKKAIHHYYVRLADGCHPDSKTKVAWAGLITKYITRMTKGWHLFPSRSPPSHVASYSSSASELD